MSDDNSNLPAERAKPVDVVRGALERLKPQLAMALPKHLSPDRLVRIAMTAVQRTPKLLECDRTSFYGAIMACAQLGLEPDGVLGQAYLIPYKGKVQLVPGYKGLLTLARNSGEISYIAAHEVRENDQFDFDFASGEPPVRKFSLKESRGEVIAFYAIARFRDGSFHWDMMTTAEVNEIRDGSDGYRGAIASAKKYGKDPDSPWIGHYVEMAKKTVIRRLAKYLPLSVQKAAEIDAQVNAGAHVSLDRYGDIVIEGESKEIEEEAETDRPASKLDRFEERHGGDRPVPRGTIDAETGEIIDDTELRSTAAAERQDAPGVSPPPAPRHPGEPSPAGHETAPQSVSPAGPSQPQQTDERTAVSADQSAESAGPKSTTSAPTPAGDLPLPMPRDIKFWGRRDGSRKLLAADSAGFLGELPLRLTECRDWAETEELERQNRTSINKLDTEERVEVAGLFSRRREQLRGVAS